MFDVCTTGDTAHIDTIFKFLPHTRQHIYIYIYIYIIFTCIDFCYFKFARYKSRDLQ